MSLKRTRYALVERDADEEEESSEEEEDEEASDVDEPEQLPKQQQQQEQSGQAKAPLRVQMSKSGGLTCHVCGQKGHKAGFVGAVYMDCPNKPCYLCKKPGHTTATCPHKMEVGGGGGGDEGSDGGSGEGRRSPAQLLLRREQSGHQARGPLAPPSTPRWQVDAAILKLHTRRVCSLAFPDNSDSHVISGDKKGGIAIWNFHQVYDRTLYSNIHRALVNSIRVAPWLPGGFSAASASSDGTVKLFDIETGSSKTLLDLNPDGWLDKKSWRMVWAADTNQELSAIFAGDSDGKVHVLDPRTAEAVNTLQLHKPGSNVYALSVNPMGGASVVLTAGNDHTAKLFDVRKLSSIRPPDSSEQSTPAAPLTPALPAAAAAAAGAAAEAAVPGMPSAAGRGSRSGRGRGRGRGRATAAAAAGAASVEPESPEAAGAAPSGSGRGRARGGRAAGAAAVAAPQSGGGRSSGNSSARARAAAAVAAAATAELACMPHGRVVNSAVFSPSGRQILTTCQDNRLRIWSNLLHCDRPADREIIHSHDFNRYLTPFKAEWFANDPSESTIICGRYISEDYGGVALHPVDIMDTSGTLLRALTDANLATITPVNLPHPRLDLIISGSSRSLYKWTPQSGEEDDERQQELSRSGGLAGSSAAAAAELMRRAAGISSSFVCVDADPNSGGKGGKGKGSTAAASKTTPRAKQASTKATKPAARGRKRGRNSRADSEDNDSDDGDDE